MGFVCWKQNFNSHRRPWTSNCTSEFQSWMRPGFKCIANLDEQRNKWHHRIQIKFINTSSVHVSMVESVASMFKERMLCYSKLVNYRKHRQKRPSVCAPLASIMYWVDTVCAVENKLRMRSRTIVFSEVWKHFLLLLDVIWDKILKKLLQCLSTKRSNKQRKSSFHINDSTLLTVLKCHCKVDQEYEIGL